MTEQGLSHEIIETSDFNHQALVIHQFQSDPPLVELTPARYKSFFHNPVCKVLVTRKNGEVADVGAIILRRNKSDKTFIATISSALSEPDYFWSTVTALANDYQANHVMLEMFGTAATDGQTFDFEAARHKTQIYVCDLSRKNLAEDLSSNHRRNIKKAEALGFSLVEESSAQAIEDHVRLCGASNDRRSGRGEKIQGNKDRQATKSYLETGQATLFQAVHEGVAYSSILVIRIGDAAYYDTGGTSPEGMKMGGSHFLMFMVMKNLQEKGLKFFSLDVANTEGLIKFKTGFGAVEWPLQRVYIEHPTLLSSLKKTISSLLRI